MTASESIRWGRIIVAAVLVEAGMFAIVIPLNGINEQVTYYSVPFLVFATAYLAARWVGRPLAGRFVLHGVLTAIGASLIYVAITIALGVFNSVPLLYHFSHALRIAGGAAGGARSARR